jgi:gamma-glutamyltranspeptidase / glutathione hydrolase
VASPNGFEILKADKNAEDGYRAPREGEIMRNPTLSTTFRTLAAEGKEGFYRGRIAKSIIDVTSSLGGHITLGDLEHHLDIGTEESTPISLRVTMMDINSSRGGLDIWEHPPNGQGLVALIALGILQELEKSGTIKKWKPHEHNSTEYLHILIESLRLAFADGHFYIADPAVTPVPVPELLSPACLSKRAALFSPTSALPQTLSHGSPALTSSDTVYFAVTDAAGNAASFINSNYAGFGTAIVPAGCGFTLQNRGANFSLDPTHPNVYAPRKRPYHTIIPALATHVDDGAVASVFGVMGGFMQPQGHVQTLLNQYVFGMSPQEALDAPRFCIGEGMPGADGTVGGTVVSVEEGIAEDVVLGLRALGHTIEVVSGYGRALFGRGQIIKVGKEDGQRVYSAGSDARADGCAIPLV